MDSSVIKTFRISGGGGWGHKVQSPDWTESNEQRKPGFWYSPIAKNISLPGTVGNARECFMVCLFVGQFQRNLDVESLKNT